MRGMALKLTRLAVCLCMVLSFVPLCAPCANAAGIGAGESFTVDNLVYTVTAGKYVQLTGVKSPAALPSVLTVPEFVDYGDASHETASYRLVGIGSSAFRGCTNLVDVRVPDLGDATETGRLYGAAFAGCTNLEVIHLMGRGTFVGWGSGDVTDFDGIENLKLVFHSQPFDFSTSSAASERLATFPNTTAYYAVDFKTEKGSTRVFVAGLRNSALGIETLATPSSLTNADAVEVYCDKAEGVESLCPEQGLPSLGEGSDAWQLTDSSGNRMGWNDALCSPCEAAAVDSHDISTATVECEPLFCNGLPQQPSVAVTSAAGASLEEGTDYTLSFSLDGTPVDKIVDAGFYPLVEASGTSSSYAASYTAQVAGTGVYRGTGLGTQRLYAPSAKWFRAYGEDACDTARAAASQASVIYKQAYEDVHGTDYSYGYSPSPSDIHRAAAATGSVGGNTRVVVAQDSWRSCIVGCSLAGVMGSTVVATPASLDDDGDLPSSVKLQLSSVSRGMALVVGGKDEVSDEVKSAISQRVDKGASRVGGEATSASQLAVAAYRFVRGVEDGTYSMDLPSEYKGYGDTVLIVPDSESAALFSAAAWAHGANALLLFCDEEGRLDQETLDVLGDIDSSGAGYFSHVVAAGLSQSAQATLSQTLSSKLPTLSVECWQGSGDVVLDSASYCSQAVQAGASYGVTVLAGPSAGWGVLSASACTAGTHDGLLLLVDFAEDAQQAFEVLKPVAYRISYGVLAGGMSEMPQSRYEEVVRLWDVTEASSVTANLRLGEVALSSSELQYTGQPVAPSVSVADREGKALAEGTDYKLSYLRNDTGEAVDASELVEPGSYTVVATGTYHVIAGGWDTPDTIVGTYWNARSAEFQIVQPAVPGEKPGKPVLKSLKVGKKSLTAVWSKVKGAEKYTVAFRVKGTKAWTTKAVSGGKSTSASIKKLKTGKRYQVRMRAGNSCGWSSWSKIKCSGKVC